MAAALFLLLLCSFVDFFDDFGLSCDGGTASIVLYEHLGSFIHNVFNLTQEFVHFGIGLLQNELRDISGELVLIFGNFLRALGMLFRGYKLCAEVYLVDKWFGVREGQAEAEGNTCGNSLHDEL